MPFVRFSEVTRVRLGTWGLVPIKFWQISIGGGGGQIMPTTYACLHQDFDIPTPLMTGLWCYVTYLNQMSCRCFNLALKIQYIQFFDWLTAYWTGPVIKDAHTRLFFKDDWSFAIFFRLEVGSIYFFGVYEKDPFTILKNYVIQNLYVSRNFFSNYDTFEKKIVSNTDPI